jgi:alpha-L-fucosidase
MKYVVITAKHHDGFSMYDSKLTDFDIVDATPYKKDPMRELADAVRAEGLVFCFYYSIPDWHHPDFPAKYSMRGGFHGNPKSDADIEKYNEFMKGQVRELLTNYGPIGILWFDGGGSFNRDDALRAKLVHADEMIAFIRELQPNCLVNNRLGVPADYGTPEQKIPGEAPKSTFEVCMTVNNHGHWGYNKHDTKFKSTQTLVRNLADIASKGGNYLLNVGPTASGEVVGPEADALRAVGKWMKTNGESIYGTTASPFEVTPAWGRVTRKGKTLYLHVFDWPRDGRLVAPLPTTGKPSGAHLLADESKKPLSVQLGEEEPVVITGLPAEAPDADDSVIVLQCE